MNVSDVPHHTHYALVHNGRHSVGLLLLLFFKGIYIAQVCKGHKCAMSAEMAVWL